MSDTPTPRTDTEKFWSDNGGWVVAAKSFEQLERELAAARGRIRRLESAGDEIAFRLRESVFTEDEVAVEEWDQAKKGKP